MFDWLRISETAKSVLWLLRNDRDGFVIGSHSMCHCGARIGIWTGNECYGLSLYYNVPKQDGSHILSGRQVRLKWRDRKAIYAELNENPRRKIIPFRWLLANGRCVRIGF